MNVMKTSLYVPACTDAHADCTECTSAAACTKCSAAKYVDSTDGHTCKRKHLFMRSPLTLSQVVVVMEDMVDCLMFSVAAKQGAVPMVTYVNNNIFVLIEVGTGRTINMLFLLIMHFFE